MKVVRVRWSDEALADANELVRYFELQQRNLGDRFVDAVEQTLELIRMAPSGGASFSAQFPTDTTIRRWPVRKFRNVYVFYHVRDGDVVLIRVLHASRGAVS